MVISSYLNKRIASRHYNTVVQGRSNVYITHADTRVDNVTSPHYARAWLHVGNVWIKHCLGNTVALDTKVLEK